MTRRSRSFTLRRAHAQSNWNNFASRTFGVRRLALARRLARGQRAVRVRAANRALTRGPYGPRRR